MPEAERALELERQAREGVLEQVLQGEADDGRSHGGAESQSRELPVEKLSPREDEDQDHEDPAEEIAGDLRQRRSALGVPERREHEPVKSPPEEIGAEQRDSEPQDAQSPLRQLDSAGHYSPEEKTGEQGPATQEGALEQPAVPACHGGT